MKLTRRRIRWLIKRKKEGMSSKSIARALKISKRRVNQVWRMYMDSGEIPVIGENIGRPKREITERERRIVLEAKKKYKLGARRLEPIIERDYGMHIPHNRIHRILLELGLAEENPKKKKRRRWIRYEREHSLSAAHMDWHENNMGVKVCVIEDDASRKILAGGEFKHSYERNSIQVFEELVERYWDKIGMLKELIIDNGSSFGAHRIDEKGDWDSEFKRAVEGYGTKIIRIRRNHPQSNGKIEKWYDTYEKVRKDFNSFQDFIDWYNTVRPHESLGWKYNHLETPEEAFWRKLPEGYLLGMCDKLFGW